MEIPGQNLPARILLKMRHAMGALPFLLALGSLPAMADTLPAYCGGVGAKSYTPPTVTIPPVILNRGTVITVTNATVAINGDTSSVKALVANPGPDGISIQEAIIATNNDPGTWVIQFAPALKGSTIVVDPPVPGPKGLSYLTGGNVTINGDIDGDGKPDITLTSLSGTATGFFVVSGGNTLHALALQNCGTCITIQRPSAKFQLPAATGTTFSSITISHVVMTNVQNTGIAFCPVCGESDTGPSGPALATRNTWDHMLIVGNTITGGVSGPLLGIDLELGNTVADTLQHTTIANNNLVLPMPGAGGIAMNIGAGIGSKNNQALDTLIANNVISGPLPQFGIRVVAGVGSGSANLIDGMQMIANQIRITSQPPGSAPRLVGITLGTGDAASDDQLPNLRPIQYSENNIARNIGILSNTIEVLNGCGIFVGGACCGNSNNTVANLSILGNTLTGGNVRFESGASGGYFSRPSTGNVLSNVLVQANSIQIAVQPGNFTMEMALNSGGIEAVAGWLEPGNRVNGLSITNNDVNTPFPGISIIGGSGAGQGPNDPPSPADNNVVSAAQISCNQVDQTPTFGVTPSSGIKGINVTAGLLNANGNQVQQLRVLDNLVGGVLGDASLFANLSGASGNAISISQISAPVNGPQFAAAGLVNAATFQQRALAPGSLVSLFGLNLNGASVQFDSLSAPIIFNSSSQLNLQVPWELQGKSSSPVAVTANSVTSAPQAIPLGLSDPGIFSLGAPQGGQGAIVNLAGIVVDANSPAHAGDYLEIYANGLGAVSHTPQTGAVALVSPLSSLIGNPTVTIGGVAAPVVFAGLAPGFIGLYQVNVQVPPGVAAGDALAVVLSIGVIASNTVTISVR